MFPKCLFVPRERIPGPHTTPEGRAAQPHSVVVVVVAAAVVFIIIVVVPVSATTAFNPVGQTAEILMKVRRRRCGRLLLLDWRGGGAAESSRAVRGYGELEERRLVAGRRALGAPPPRHGDGERGHARPVGNHRRRAARNNWYLVKRLIVRSIN
jgi:hypothetical protein